MTERPHDPTGRPSPPTEARSGVGQGNGWILLVGVEVLLVVLLLPYGTVFHGSLTLHLAQLAVLGAVGAVGWIVIIWRPSALSPFVVLAPLPLLAAVAATSLTSSYPSLSWPAAWHTVAYAGIFWLLARQASHPAGRRTLIVVIGIVVTFALASFLAGILLEWRRWLGLGFPVMPLPLRPSNTGGLTLTPTMLADLAALGTPVVVAGLWHRRARIAAATFAAIALGAIVLTGTRSVLLFLAVACVVAVLIALRGRVGRRALTAATIGVLVVGIAASIVALGSSRSLDEGRSSAYASAIARITESPLVGTGPGTYGVERMHDPVNIIAYLAFPDAHNIVLNNLAESGIVGMLGLLATVALFALAIRGSWRRSPGERLIIAGAVFGLAIFMAHGMVDVVFSMVGVMLVAVGIAAIAATSGVPAEASDHPRPRTLRVGLGAAFLVSIILTGGAVRTAWVARTVSAADAALANRPAHALELARQATATAPDMVPAWWVQMVAADAVGDTETAIAAARKLTELEGFGQEWMSLAVLAARQGDRTTEAIAIGSSAGRVPIDPMVELNAVALLGARGDTSGAAGAARRLLAVQPDIEAIVRSGPEPVAAAVAAVRADVARQMMSSGDADGAFLVALSGEDRALSTELLSQVTTLDVDHGLPWSTIVDAWFGDTTARATLDRSTRATPTADRMVWSWRLAGRACDDTGSSFWERAMRIAHSYVPETPNALNVSGAKATRNLPARYPEFVWRLAQLRHPYVSGTLTFGTGRPICQRVGG